jgi:hypothetical protein
LSSNRGQEEDSCWCCGLTKEHLEAFIYWAITCWNARSRAGRANISYRKYKPLRADHSAMEEDETAAAASRGGGGSVSANSEAEEGKEDDSWLQARRNAEATNSGANNVAPVRKAPKRHRKPQQTSSQAQSQQSPLQVRRRQTGESDSSSDSDAEIEVMLQSAPADVNVERGMWLRATKWWGVGN